VRKCFAFDSLNEVIGFSSIVEPFYTGKNSLYKDDVDERYYLVLNVASLNSGETFNKVCNIAAEYGIPEQTRYASVEYYDEHFTKIIKDSAVKKLAKLKR
ncbi:MAG: adaptor protein MecA, partial [Butyrivibrio sp.]|nr:adaptor protein MecA [Butyrivibrio sp.]